MAIHPEGFVRDQWYVVGWSDEISRDLIAGMILGRPVVLYRRADGTIAALEDICPHRWVPLSMGKRVDDDVVCAYHGHRFNSAGDCVLVPSQPDRPSKAKVRSYPVAERAPLVWIWTGDPAAADESRIPATSELSDPAFKWAVAKVDIEANYLLMHENTLDQTHFHALHASFAATPEWDTGEI